MHFEALKYFMYVVEEKSISKAAKKAHISQSALSQTIHKLEEDLGCELLKRSNRGVTLTGQGEIVLKHTSHVLNNMNKMVEELKEFDANQNNIIISGTWSLAAYSLPCMMYKLKKKFPEIKFDLVAQQVDEILRDIRDDMSDFGFIDVIPEESDLIFHNIGHEKIVLIAKSDYKVKEVLTVDELINVELIMCTMSKKTCEHLDDALKEKGKRLDNLNVIFSADSLTSVKSSVMNGYGMAFVPYESIKRELYEKKIKLVDVDNLNLDYDIYLVSKKLKSLSPCATKARDYLKEIGSKAFC